MAGSLWISPQAQRDVAELAIYIGRQSIASADRLFEEFYSLADRLAAFPGLGQAFPTSHTRLEGLRVARIPHFPNHLVFYLPREGGVHIIRVLHGASDLDAIFGESDH